MSCPRRPSVHPRAVHPRSSPIGASEIREMDQKEDVLDKLDDQLGIVQYGM
jgi:hypothetical protein